MMYITIAGEFFYTNMCTYWKMGTRWDINNSVWINSTRGRNDMYKLE